MSDISKEAVDALLQGVTAGPWRIKDCESLGYRSTDYYQEIWNDETDILVTTEVTRAHNDGGARNMRFIAASRELVPALRAALDEAEARADRLDTDVDRLIVIRDETMAERDAANALLRRITRNVDADGVGTVLIIDLQAARAHLGAKP